MFRFKSPVFIAIAILVFVTAAVLSFLFRSYEVAVSGLLIMIVLTAFIPGWRSTLFAGVVSMVAMTGLVIYFRDETNVMEALLSQLYSLLVIIFAVVIVFYLKRIQQNLAHEKTHMTSLFENATEGILLTDKTGSIVLVNPSANKMFGYENGEMNGEKIEVLIPTRYHGHHSQLRDGFYKDPGNRPMGKGRDLYARRKDGSEFPVEISLSHYYQKNEPFVIAFIVDITTRKEIEQNLIHQRIEL
jgi:PAS domain S-box-containing protein